MQDVVVDTCCLINLCAANRILSGEPPHSPRTRRKIIRPGSSPSTKKPSLHFKLHIPVKVRDEARYILKPDDEDPTKLVQTQIDLSPYFQAGFLHPCDLETGKETELFVRLATRLDDGEAACFAIAVNRGWLLATDERPTERLAKQEGVTIITTPELVKHWADSSGVSEEEVAKVVWCIRTFAHYFPRKTLPLHSWWMDLLKKVK
jgi:hypothetical protein